MSGWGLADARGRQRRLWIVATALFARWATFGNPLVHIDEGFYLTVARAMWQGQLPFVDIWDRKPIGLFLIYLPAAAVPFAASVWLYQLCALAAAVATAALVARIADRLGWGRGALPGAIAYLCWLNLASGQGGQAAVFFNLPIAGAAWLLLGNPVRRWRPDLAAMLLVGIALQVKYSVVFEGVFFGLVAAGRLRPLPGWAARAAVLALVASAPTLLACAVYAAIGQLPAFWFANIVSVLLRPADPAAERYARLLASALKLAPLVVAALAVRHWQPRTRERRFALAWFAVAILGILAFGGWLDHYALPAMLPGAVAAAGFFDAIADRRRTVAALLALAAMLAEAAMLNGRTVRGTPAQFAALRTAVEAAPPGCLYVYAGPTVLYPATGRCALSRFVFPNHLTKIAEAPAIGADQRREVRRILAARPAVIVVRSWRPGERRDVRALVAAAIRRDYTRAAVLPLGQEPATVFYRRTEG